MTVLINEEIIKLKNAIQNQRLVFIVGAGISFEAPSFLTTWPQLQCIRALIEPDSRLEALSMDKIRPEVFFQILYNVINERALIPINVLNPDLINSEEEIVFPNLIHYFLAEMINKGHVVLTTNFDNLIERAYFKSGYQKNLKVIIFDDDYKNASQELESKNLGYLIKFHGSFTSPEGKDCRDSIRAILQQVQREIPDSKLKLVKALITKYDCIVLGYSGLDDFDLYNFLITYPSNRQIWWVRHTDNKNLDSWKVFKNDQLEFENKKIGKIPQPKILSSDWEILNSFTIALSYRNGVVIEIYTRAFIELLISQITQKITSGFRQKVKSRTNEIIKNWVNGINKAERFYILSAIYEIIGEEHLEDALKYYEHAVNLHKNLIMARNLLKYCNILYKKGGNYNWSKAKDILEKLIKDFEELDSISDLANNYLQLVLINNRLNNAIDGIIYGEKAIELFNKLIDFNKNSNLFEIGQALRTLALIYSRNIPDISSIKNEEDRNENIKKLNQALQLCKLSINILFKTGNRTGLGGEGQSYNVLGLIKQKLGNYNEAKLCFEKFLSLSGRSRFLWEGFQAYRNLGLCIYNIAMSELDFGHKIELLEESIQNYRNCIECLNGDPKEPNERSMDPNMLSARFYRSKALIERGKMEDLEFAIDELNAVIESSKLVFSEEIWHRKAICLSGLSQAYLKLNNFDNYINYIGKMVKEYEKVKDEIIKNHSVGIQTAKKNLEMVKKELLSLEYNKNTKNVEKKVIKQLNRVNKLIQQPSLNLSKDWIPLINNIRSKITY